MNLRVFYLTIRGISDGYSDYVTECLVETLGFSVFPSHQILSEK